MNINPIPKGYHTVTPYLLIEEPQKLIDFLEAAFDAECTECIRDKEGHVKHAEVRVGSSMIMMGMHKNNGPSNVMLYLYVEDTDATYQKALAAGGKSLMQPADQFYGDRNAGVEDLFGNRWWIASRIEDLSQSELEKRSQAFHEKQV